MSQFFKIHFEEVVLELLAPSVREEKVTSTAVALSTRGIPPYSRWGCRQTLHQSFPSLVGLSRSLTDTGAILFPPGSTTKTG